jgi:CHAT domain-containing protein
VGLLALLVLLLVGPGTQDAATALADRIEAASVDERAAILAREGPTGPLNTAARLLVERSYRDYQAGRYDKAISLNRFLLDVADVVQKPLLKGTAYQMIGQALSLTEKYAEAIDAYELGLPLAREGGDKRLEAVLWSMEGDALRLTGQSEESRTAGENAVRLFMESDRPDDAVQALVMLGTTVRLMGEWQLALDYYTQALKLAETANVPLQVESALLAMAAIYTNQNDYGVALSYLDRLTRPAGNTMPEKRRIVRQDSELGHVYLRLKRPEARAVLERALREAEEINYRTAGAWILQRLAELDQKRDPQLALQRYRDAALYYESIGDTTQTNWALTLLANVYTQLKQPEQAAAAAHRSVDAARQGSGSSGLLGSALDELGRALRDSGRTKEAQEAFAESIVWMEAQRSEVIGGDTLGSNFLIDRAAPYTSLMDLRARDGNTLDAIHLAEQVHARWLLDALAQSHVDPQNELSPDEKRREQMLAREAAKWNADLRKPKPASDAQARFEKAARDLELYRTELYGAHSRLKARRGQAEPLTEAALLALVPDSKTLLVEFAFSERGAWIFTAARSAAGALELKATPLAAKREDVEKQVEQFRQALATRALSYAAPAHELYRGLLAPIESQLKGRTNIGIVPDGPLWNLPFQVLIGPDGKYLIERAAVFYAPSLTVLHDTLRARPRSGAALKPLLAFAAGAPDLPNTAEEVRQLASLYGSGSVALSGAQATETRWKRDAGGFRVLHLATHGILNSTNPLFSYLQLAKAGSDDGMLEAREILGLSLPAELAVLSACETGLGEVVGGEGLVGMSWAMLTAGTPTVVVSQWKVDSESTTQLMLAFHRTIAAASAKSHAIEGKAQALRAAELELLRTPRFHHPFYWAGFEMLGNGY